MDIEKITQLAPDQLNGLIQQIGNTPLKAVYLTIAKMIHKIYLKMEGFNPVGSIKDRTGLALIQDLEEYDRLRPGSIIIESTSGNLGVSLALVCKAKGYGFVAVVDPKATSENISKMRALGAQIDLVQQLDVNGGYLLSRLDRVQHLCRQSKHYVWTNQYGNLANPRVHADCTGLEIYRQMHGQVDAIFVPVSTGGTLAGIGYFFRKASPSTRIIGVDAHGSVVFGAPPGPRKLTGIGSSRPSQFISRELYDTYMLVGDEEAFAFCRCLLNITGMMVGGSSGAVLAACTRYLQNYPELKRVVCICADDGANYASSIFNDQWFEQQQLQVVNSYMETIQTMLLEVVEEEILTRS